MRRLFSLPYYHPTFHLSAPCALQSANTRLYLSKGQAHNELAPLSFGSSDGEQSVHRFIPRFHYRWRHFYNPPAHPRRGQNTSFCVCDPKATHTITFIALPNALHSGTNGVNQILVGDADRGLLLTLRLGELVAPLLTTLTHTNRKTLFLRQAGTGQKQDSSGHQVPFRKGDTVLVNENVGVCVGVRIKDLKVQCVKIKFHNGFSFRY